MNGRTRNRPPVGGLAGKTRDSQVHLFREGVEKQDSSESDQTTTRLLFRFSAPTNQTPKLVCIFAFSLFFFFRS